MGAAHLSLCTLDENLTCIVQVIICFIFYFLILTCIVNVISSSNSVFRSAIHFFLGAAGGLQGSFDRAILLLGAPVGLLGGSGRTILLLGAPVGLLGVPALQFFSRGAPGGSGSTILLLGGSC